MKSWLVFLPLVRCDVIWNGFFDANFTVDHFDQCTPPLSLVSIDIHSKCTDIK